MNFYTRQNNVNSVGSNFGEANGSAESNFNSNNLFNNDTNNDIGSYEDDSASYSSFGYGRNCFYRPPFYQDGYCQPQHGCYPPQHGCYPPQHGYYPPQHGCYPPQHGCYPSQHGCYPPQHGCYPPQHGCYPPQHGCYPPQHGCYPPIPRRRRPNGAIIPYASGNTQAVITTIIDTLPTNTTGYVAAIGFGDTQNGITIGAGGELSLSSGNMAFSIPRNGKITSLTTHFTNTIQVSLGTSVLQISAQLYRTVNTTNVFYPISGTKINLTPTLTGVITAGSVFSETLNKLHIPVTQGTRLILVFYASVISGPGINTTLTGLASAGVNII